MSRSLSQPPVGSNESSKGFYQYDLYAVCNHHGSDLQGGHYTATCRNPTDGQWYLFDDNHVQKLDSEREVVSDEAYILFYQRYNSTNNHHIRAKTSVYFCL